MKSLLYSFINEEKLGELLEAFYTCLELPIQVIDDKGTPLCSFGPPGTFCHLFEKHLPADDSCEKHHTKAAYQAYALGETYIFSCHAGLNHIVFPLVNKNVFLGAVLVGPFLMEEPDSLLLLDLEKKYHLSAHDLLKLYENTASIPLVSPAKATQISRLLYYLFSSLITDGLQHFIMNQEKFHQQAKINESIQMYKNQAEAHPANYPYDKEKALITKIKTGSIPEAKAILNDLLGYVFFSEGNSLETIKFRALELCSLLSRAAIEGGAPTDSILKLNNQFLKIIPSIQDLDDLCYKLQESIDAFTESMFNYVPTKHHELMKKAILYLSRHYMEPVTLEETAGHVGLNPAYFSTLFKQSCGSSFKEYLNMIRIEESKRLLANTDYPILDIAVSVGFEDQSYFSKVFKKYTGLTPKQYR